MVLLSLDWVKFFTDDVRSNNLVDDAVGVDHSLRRVGRLGLQLNHDAQLSFLPS